MNYGNGKMKQVEYVRNAT